MRAAAAEVQALARLGLVVRPPVVALPQRGPQPERGAPAGVEPLGEVVRREDALERYVVAHVLVHRLALHQVEHALAIPGHLFRTPARTAVGQRRHRHQHVERLAALGRERRIERARRVAVERGIVGEAPVVEDVGDVALEVGREPDGVHRLRRVALVQAQVQDEARARVLHALELLVGEAAARLAGQQVLHGVGEVGVAHHVVRAHQLAARHHADGAAILHRDALHGRRRVQLAAQLLEQARHALGHGVHAARHEPHAVKELDQRDDHVQRRPLVRRDADVERLERQRLAQPVIGHVARHRRVRVSQRVQTEAGDQALRVVEVGRLAERALQEVVLGDAEALVQQRQVLEVALCVRLAHALERGRQVGQVVRQAHALARAEGYLHERLDLPQGDVVVGVAPGQLEHLAVQRGHHHDGGPHVEGEPGAGDAAHLAAHLRLLLVQRHVVPGMPQPDGRRQPGGARPHHDYPFHATP